MSCTIHGCCCEAQHRVSPTPIDILKRIHPRSAPLAAALAQHSSYIFSPNHPRTPWLTKYSPSQLGIPTANIPLSGLSVGGHSDVESGVYYGWAGLSPSSATHQHPPHSQSKYTHMATHLYDALVDLAFGSINDAGEKSGWTADKGAVYPMVMSIGWNPFYKNTVRSVEVHIMHQFEEDFYGSMMNVLICGFIRKELDYVNKEKLIEDIMTDISVAGKSLARAPYSKLRKDKFLLDFEGAEEVAK